jgi:hypothetical protein
MRFALIRALRPDDDAREYRAMVRWFVASRWRLSPACWSPSSNPP